MQQKKQMDLFSNEVEPDPVFHNTIDLKGDELKQSEEKAQSQNELVKAFFLSRPGAEFTPFEVHTLLNLKKSRTPVTSIRRAITTLTKEGWLTKLPKQKKEQFGAKNYYWKLNQEKQTEETNKAEAWLK